jgi:hypothetical protein
LRTAPEKILSKGKYVYEEADVMQSMSAIAKKRGMKKQKRKWGNSTEEERESSIKRKIKTKAGAKLRDKN